MEWNMEGRNDDWTILCCNSPNTWIDIFEGLKFNTSLQGLDLAWMVWLDVDLDAWNMTWILETYITMLAPKTHMNEDNFDMMLDILNVATNYWEIYSWTPFPIIFTLVKLSSH